MEFLMKIIKFHALLHVAIAQRPIDLSGIMNMTWTQLTPHTHNNSLEPPYYDIFIGKDNHKLALLRWEIFSEAYPSKPNLTIRTHDFNDEIHTNTCDVDSPFKDDHKWVFAEGVRFLKSDRVLISWRTEHKTEGLRISSQVIFIDVCKSSDFINVPTTPDSKHKFDRVFHVILRRNNSFDVVFENQAICPQNYCQLSFNYDGEPLSTSLLPFSKSMIKKNETLHINSLFAMDNNSGTGVVLTGNKNGFFYSPTSGLMISHDVYSSKLGWTKAEGLYRNHHVYSNSSGFATLCWIQTDHKLCCEWLDGTHRNEDGSKKTLVLDVGEEIDTPWILNSPDGHIILIKPGYEGTTKLIFVNKVTVEGECKTLVKIRYKDQPLRVDLSIAEQNRFCFSFIVNHMKNTTDKAPSVRTHSFLTKCMIITNR